MPPTVCFQGKCRLYIPTIVRLIMIWDELFSQIRVSFDGMVSRTELLLEYIRRIKTHLDVVVEVLEVQSISTLEFRPGDEFIEFC